MKTVAACRWFSATLVFESRIAGIASVRPLCEERIVLFAVQGNADVALAARQYGGMEEHSYVNGRGQHVAWRFVGVSAIEVLAAPPHEGRGWEVGSRFVRKRQQSLREIIRKRA